MTIRRLINRTTIGARRLHATAATLGPRWTQSDRERLFETYPLIETSHIPRAAEAPASPLTRVTTLFPSGLRVATDSTPASKTATIGVFVDVGSRFETLEFKGTTHFLEHMLFKGTKTRNAQELEEEIEKVVIGFEGHRMNAFTTRERTGFHAKVLPQDVPLALDIFSDVLQNSIFDEESIARERDVILREKYEVEGKIQEFIFNQLHDSAFLYSSLGRTVIGAAESIETISREHLLEYMFTHYTAPRMVVAASGAVDHEHMVDRVKKLFKNLPTQPTPPPNPLFGPKYFIGCTTQILRNDYPLAHVAVAFEGASWTDPDSIGLMLVQRILGSWNKQDASAEKHIGSDLARKICKDGLAESMATFNFNYKDTGLFGVYAVAEPNCLNGLAHAIIHEIKKLRYQVSEDDVIRAQNKLKSYFLCQCAGMGAEYIGHQLLSYGRSIPYAELFERIDHYDARRVKRVANRFLFDSDVVVVGVGPCECWPDRQWFRRMAIHPL